MSKEKNERNEKKEEAKRAQLENDEKRDDKVKELGQLTLDENEQNHKIYLLSIIGAYADLWRRRGKWFGNCRNDCFLKQTLYHRVQWWYILFV